METPDNAQHALASSGNRDELDKAIRRIIKARAALNRAAGHDESREQIGMLSASGGAKARPGF